MNCPPLLLPLPCDQRVRMPVNVHARSFPATIRETSSLPNRHPCHRGSHSADNGCKISTRYPATFHPSSRTAPKRLHEQFTPPSTTWSKVEKPHQQPPERHCQLNGVEVSFRSPLGSEGLNSIGVPRTSPHRTTAPPTAGAYHLCLS